MHVYLTQPSGRPPMSICRAVYDTPSIQEEEARWQDVAKKICWWVESLAAQSLLAVSQRATTVCNAHVPSVCYLLLLLLLPLHRRPALLAPHMPLFVGMLLCFTGTWCWRPRA